MKKLIYLLLLMLIILLTYCNKKSDYSKQVDSIEEPASAISKNHPGKKLLEAKCYVCHSSTAQEYDGRIGPPMIAVKAYYINEQTTQEEFTEAMWSFLKSPSAEKAKLRDAVKRFGVMPYQPLKKKEIVQISEYLFEYKIDEPEWFKEHWESKHNTKGTSYINSGKKIIENSNPNYEEVGLKYALNTKKELGKNLIGTIQKKGIKEAVTFCNKQAYPITDSMATVHNATIRRVSDKPRDQNNQANAKELAVIAQFKEVISNNEVYKSITKTENGKVTFYAPITTNSMCLQCHGTPNTTIQTEVYKTIRNLYPEDKAIGYDINEVRGIWSITYNQ